MPKDIAIIGISGKFPKANNLNELHHLLKNGKDCIEDISHTRISDTSLDFSKKYKPGAFLEGIDKFDHKFFNISMSEAEHMDPHQRILLEVVQETLDSAACNNFQYFGSNTAVFVGDTNQAYYKLAETFDPTLITGNSDSSTAGRISRFFGFRALATMVDTACSSGLLAVHLACKELLSGDAEMAIAAGIRLMVFPDENNQEMDMGILSSDGKTKSFSANADGTGVGESCACVLLKPLEKAKKDGDIIYAVIKGSACNQDADRSGSLTAPSAEAQSIVLQKAWENAGVDPKNICYIETHGSGTKLGDPIEVNAIDMAFKASEKPKHSCEISSIKTNVGHTGNNAGLSGLLKAVLSIKNHCFYPSLHFDEPSPFINFSASVAQVTTEFKAWPSNQARLAAVSSFGLSGTNCHIVLEEYQQMNKDVSATDVYFFPVSAKSKASLNKNVNNLKEYLETEANLNLKNLSYTLCLGRNHYTYKTGFCASSKFELIQKLSEFNIEKINNKHVQPMYIFSNKLEETLDLKTYTTSFPAFTENFDVIHKLSFKQSELKNIAASQYGIYSQLSKLGLANEELLGVGIGDALIAYLLEEETLDDLSNYSDIENHDGLLEKLEAMVIRECQEQDLLFVDMGHNSYLYKLLATIKEKHQQLDFNLITLNIADNYSIWSLIKALYCAGHEPDWAEISNLINGQKTPLPTYAFDRKRCWLKEKSNSNGNNVAAQKEKVPIIEAKNTQLKINRAKIDDTWSSTEQIIAQAWIESLKLDSLSINDDFFKIGGHSLIAIKVIGKIEKHFNIKINFKDAFTFATVKNFAAAVDQLLQSSNQTNYAQLEKAPILEYYPVSHAQKRMWLFQQSFPESCAYNLPTALLIKGKFDLQKAENAWKQLIERHEALRTVFVEKGGELYQKVNSSFDFTIEKINSSFSNVNNSIHQFVKAFILSRDLMIRVAVQNIDSNENLLLFDMHHIASDGVSLSILSSEFIELYNSGELNNIDYQYKDFAYWEKQQFANGTMEEHKGFWLNYLENTPPLNLPLDYQRKAFRTYKGSSISLKIDEQLWDKTINSAKAEAVSLYTFLLASYTILLHKYSEQSDIAVGSPIAGRSKEEFQPIVGMFVNTIVNRNRIDTSQSINQFIAQVHNNVLNVFSHQDYPFDAISDEVSGDQNNNSNPIFDTMFALQNIEYTKAKLGDTEIEALPIENNTALFDITFEINQKDDKNAELKISYNSDLFQESTLELMGERWLSLLDSMTQNTALKIEELNWNLTHEIGNSTAPSFDLDLDL